MKLSVPRALVKWTMTSCLACITCMSTIGQTHELDSLGARLRTEGPTTARVDMLIRIGMWTYDATGDTACLVFLKEAAALSTTLGYLSLIHISEPTRPY